MFKRKQHFDKFRHETKELIKSYFKYEIEKRDEQINLLSNDI